MFHFIQNGTPFGSRPPYKRGWGGGLLINGIICVLFGLTIIAQPELLAYIVATFFIFAGVTLLSIWWKMRR